MPEKRESQDREDLAQVAKQQPTQGWASRFANVFYDYSSVQTAYFCKTQWNTHLSGHWVSCVA